MLGSTFVFTIRWWNRCSALVEKIQSVHSNRMRDRIASSRAQHKWQLQCCAMPPAREEGVAEFQVFDPFTLPIVLSSDQE
jgi:hypothetical protein